MRVETVKALQRVMPKYKYQTLHNRLLQDKEIAVRDCDQNVNMFLQDITLTCWLKLSLCFYAVFTIILFFDEEIYRPINL